MDSFEQILLAVAGFIAGVIDSIAGGGGLVTVPLLTILIGPGATAIGTNKVAAVASSLFALFVYMKRGHVTFSGNIRFVLLTGLGAAVGASLSPLIPKEAYRWILVAICPVILWIVFKKDIWIKHEAATHSHLDKPNRLVFWAAGFLCGFYDGIAGPGGGTLMFLALFLVARIPLISAMATAKLANLSSASLSLATFTWSGHVHWGRGSVLALGISAGAFLGASLALRHSQKMARAALLVVATLLLLRLMLQ